MLIAAGLARNSRLYRNARVSTLVLKRAKSCLFSEGSMIFSYVFRAELAIQYWSVGGSYTALQHHKTRRPVTQAQWKRGALVRLAKPSAVIWVARDRIRVRCSLIHEASRC